MPNHIHLSDEQKAQKARKARKTAEAVWKTSLSPQQIAVWKKAKQEWRNGNDDAVDRAIHSLIDNGLASTQNKAFLENFQCAITQSYTKNPHYLSTNPKAYYEHDSLKAWFDGGNQRDPTTRATVNIHNMHPSKIAKSCMRSFIFEPYIDLNVKYDIRLKAEQKGAIATAAGQQRGRPLAPQDSALAARLARWTAIQSTANARQRQQQGQGVQRYPIRPSPRDIENAWQQLRQQHAVQQSRDAEIMRVRRQQQQQQHQQQQQQQHQGAVRDEAVRKIEKLADKYKGNTEFDKLQRARIPNIAKAVGAWYNLKNDPMPPAERNKWEQSIAYSIFVNMMLCEVHPSRSMFSSYSKLNSTIFNEHLPPELQEIINKNIETGVKPIGNKITLSSDVLGKSMRQYCIKHPCYIKPDVQSFKDVEIFELTGRIIRPL